MNLKPWKNYDGTIYQLTEEEIQYLEQNRKIGNTVTIPRTGWSLNGEDLTMKYHGVKSNTENPVK